MQDPRKYVERGTAVTRSRIESSVRVVPAPQVIIGRGAEVAVLNADAARARC